MALPSDYAERVYAGVLGKIIGVYLGRPFEGWRYRDILAKLGEIRSYVHERLNVPLIVTDDDISGTFAFARALAEHAPAGADLSARQVGQTWLNHIIENKTILWWGGIGASTEHTAFLRLSAGIDAPASGSMTTNGRVVAEQIGSQIFIDGWAMVAPGNPALAVSLATRAASVSHDGEAIYGAQVIAAMEAQAFVEPNLDKLLDVAVGFIPRDSVIYRLIDDLRSFRGKDDDWRRAMTDLVEPRYGYASFGGGCHMVPNHALIILALLYCRDSFDEALMIANTCGWDTDCNSGNVGCLMGIKNGLAGLGGGYDWRGPVADRLYVATADGGSVVTDAVREAITLVNHGRRLAGEAAPLAPKDGARFHFTFPGSVQGFMVDATDGHARVTNVDGSLAIVFSATPTRVSTPTFITPANAVMPGYALLACPTLSPGQQVRAVVRADAHVRVALFVGHYGKDDQPTRLAAPPELLRPRKSQELTWTIPQLDGQPIFEVGFEISGTMGDAGTVYVDSLTWDGAPTVTLDRPAGKGEMWRRQWVDAVDRFAAMGGLHPRAGVLTLVQNRGRGIAIHGTDDWRDYSVTAALAPHLASATGLAARVQGLRRYYALLLTVDASGTRQAKLVRRYDDQEVTLAASPFAWTWDSANTYDLSLTVAGPRLTASLDGRVLFDATDDALDRGAIGLIVDTGRVGTGPVSITAM